MGGDHVWRFALPLCVLAVQLVAVCSVASASAQDLAAAQAEEAQAAAEVAAAGEDLDVRQDDFAPIAVASDEAEEAAEAALDRVDDLEEQMIDRRVEAAEEVAKINAAHSDEIDSYDKRVDLGIGAALALLLLAGLVLAWDSFRGMPIIDRLSRESQGRTIGALGIGALAIVIAGAALTSGGSMLRIIGAFSFVFGLGLLVSLVVARHSVRRERGESQAILVKDRFSRRAALGLALLLALLCAASLGSAALSEEPGEPAIPTQIESLAEAAQDDPADPPTEQVREARQAAQPLVAKADRLDDLRNEAEQRVDDARAVLADARRRASKARTRTRQVTRLIARQARAAELEAERLARQQARAEEQAEDAATPSSPDYPSYANCDEAPSDIPVPPGSSLDADGDGIGCES